MHKFKRVLNRLLFEDGPIISGAFGIGSIIGHNYKAAMVALGIASALFITRILLNLKD
jgi:hypothetical protein